MKRFWIMLVSIILISTCDTFGFNKKNGFVEFDCQKDHPIRLDYLDGCNSLLLLHLSNGNTIEYLKNRNPLQEIEIRFSLDQEIDLEGIFNSLKGCQDLKILRLIWLRTAIIPENISQFTKLESLHIQDCYKSKKNIIFPKTMNNLTNLDTLTLSMSENFNFPNSIAMISNLKIISINYINLEDSRVDSAFAILSKLKKLRILSITHCKMNYIPENIVEMKNLEIFGVTDNNLTELPGFLTKMKRLNNILIFSSNFAIIDDIYKESSIKVCINFWPKEDIDKHWRSTQELQFNDSLKN